MVGLQTIKLKKGQFVYGNEQACMELGIPKTTFFRNIKRIEDVGNVELKPERKFTLVTIVNWEKYQVEQYKAERKWNDSGMIAERQRNDSGTLAESNNNEKNDKNDKNDNNTRVRAREKKNPPPDKFPHGEFQNVMLSDAEYVKLMNRFPDYEERIERLSAYMSSTGKKYASHYATILNWARKYESTTKSKTEQMLDNSYRMMGEWANE